MNKAILAIRGAYAAFNRGDFDAAVASLDPNIDWTEPATFPGGGTYHGRDAVKGYLSQSRSGWTQGTSKPVRLILAGNRIVVFVFVRFRPKGGNDWHEAKIADVYTVRRGKIVQMNAFADRHEALRWAGVKDAPRK
ncbi:MAG TPA: nuclear transport factor 2 family protein [Candidatus Acidoferrales bacterium]|nr:nuclear transport factor 2 family protein [Candidatus Acidoferrales bacterium]